MGVIKKLNSVLISQIAAGEVIERPSSVIRELLDNAVDAGANQIRVQIEGGGLQRILIEDNGGGIEKEDLPFAIERHATSKIETLEDLHCVKTMGFRGEALASIASVSNFTIRSKKSGSDIGNCISVSAGIPGEIQMDTKIAVGTQMIVEQLFLHVPARRKFLKSENHEVLRCKSEFLRCAAGHPEIGFQFKNENKLIYDFKPQNALERIKSIFGSPWSMDMQSVNYTMIVQGKTIRLEGFVSAAKPIGTHKEMEFLFVNGRYIKDKTLSHAIKEAFLKAKSIKDGAYALWLYMDEQDVDVNAHPAKVEVRFKDVRVLHQIVYLGILQAFGVAPVESVDKTKELLSSMPYPKAQDAISQLSWLKQNQREEVEDNLFNPLSGGVGEERVKSSSFLSENNNGTDLLAKNGWQAIPSLIGGVFVIQQSWWNVYCFSKFQEQFLNNNFFPSQKLLIPFEMEMEQKDLAIIERNKSSLSSIGFEFEIAGKTLKLLSLCNCYLQMDLHLLVKQLVSSLSGNFQLLDLFIALNSCNEEVLTCRTFEELISNSVFAETKEFELLRHSTSILSVEDGQKLLSYKNSGFLFFLKKT